MGKKSRKRRRNRKKNRSRQQNGEKYMKQVKQERTKLPIVRFNVNQGVCATEHGEDFYIRTLGKDRMERYTNRHGHPFNTGITESFKTYQRMKEKEVVSKAVEKVITACSNPSNKASPEKKVQTRPSSGRYSSMQITAAEAWTYDAEKCLLEGSWSHWCNDKEQKDMFIHIAARKVEFEHLKKRKEESA